MLPHLVTIVSYHDLKPFFPITGTVEPGIWNTLRGHQKSILFHMKVIFKQGKYSWANYISSFNGKMIKKYL